VNVGFKAKKGTGSPTQKLEQCRRTSFPIWHNICSSRFSLSDEPESPPEIHSVQVSASSTRIEVLVASDSRVLGHMEWPAHCRVQEVKFSAISS
jgi:hypothetical protein